MDNPEVTTWCNQLCDMENGLMVIPKTGSTYTAGRYLKRKHGINIQDNGNSSKATSLITEPPRDYISLTITVNINKFRYYLLRWIMKR